MVIIEMKQCVVLPGSVESALQDYAKVEKSQH